MKKNLSSIAKKVKFDNEIFVNFYQKTLHEGKTVLKILIIGDFKIFQCEFWKGIYKDAIMHLMISDNESKEDLFDSGYFVYNAYEAEGISNQFDIIVDNGTFKSDIQQQIFKNLFLNNLSAKGLYFFENLKIGSSTINLFHKIFNSETDFKGKFIEPETYTKILLAVDFSDSNSYRDDKIACISKKQTAEEKQKPDSQVKNGIPVISEKNKRTVWIETFLVHDKIPFPADNAFNFEEYFAQQYISGKVNIPGYEYLPVFWTGYFNDPNIEYGLKINGINGLLKTLSTDKKYFTILQSTIPVDFGKIDVTIFSMSASAVKGSKVKIVKIPLIGEYKAPMRMNKDIFASYVGNLTIPIAGVLFDMCYRNLDFHFATRTTIESYHLDLSRTILSMCPADYNENSFRIWESLVYGAIPIYITENPFLPAFYSDKKPFMLVCAPRDIEVISQKTYQNMQLRNELLENGSFYLKEYYNYESLFKFIQKFLNKTR
jgi:hypothetical protein